MNTFLKYCLFFGLTASCSSAIANDQINPGGDTFHDPEEEQIEPQIKHVEKETYSFEFTEERNAIANSKPCVSRKCVHSFSDIILNSIPNDYLNTKNQSFFILPFSIDLK